MSRRPTPELKGRPRRELLAWIRKTQPNCGICGLPIDLTLDPKTDEMGSTVDEIVPRSRSADRWRAAHDPKNLQHAHRSCNSAKKDSVVTEEHYSREW